MTESGPRYITNPQCSGTEDRLVDCSNSTTVDICSLQTVTVNCQGTIRDNCIHVHRLNTDNRNHYIKIRLSRCFVMYEHNQLYYQLL